MIEVDVNPIPADLFGDPALLAFKGKNKKTKDVYTRLRDMWKAWSAARVMIGSNLVTDEASGRVAYSYVGVVTRHTAELGSAQVAPYDHLLLRHFLWQAVECSPFGGASAVSNQMVEKYNSVINDTYSASTNNSPQAMHQVMRWDNCRWHLLSRGRDKTQRRPHKRHSGKDNPTGLNYQCPFIHGFLSAAQKAKASASGVLPPLWEYTIRTFAGESEGVPGSPDADSDPDSDSEGEVDDDSECDDLFAAGL